MNENIKQLTGLGIIICVLWSITIETKQLFSDDITIKQTQNSIIDNILLYKDIPTTTPPLAYCFNYIFIVIFPANFVTLAEYLFLSTLVIILIYLLGKDLVQARFSSHSGETPLYSKLLYKAGAPVCIIMLQFLIGWKDVSAMLGIVLILFATLFLFRYYDKMSDNGIKFSHIERKSSALLGIIPLGICVGLLCVTRQDMASYMWGMFFWAMFWAGMADVEGRKLSLIKRATKGLLQGMFFTAIMLIVACIILYYFVVNCGLEAMYKQLIVEFFKQQKVQFLFPLSQTGIIFYLPLLLSLMSLIVLIINNRRRIIRANTPLFWKEMLAINLTLNTFNYSLLGDGLSNTLPAMLFATLLMFNIIAFLGYKQNDVSAPLFTKNTNTLER